MIQTDNIVIAAIIAGAFVWHRVAGDERSTTLAFWALVWGGVWKAFAQPTGDDSDVHGPFAARALSLTVWLASLLCIYVYVEWLSLRRAAWRAVRANPARLLSEYKDWPGFRKSAGAVAILLLLLVCFELAMCVVTTSVGSGLRAGILSVSSLVAAIATFCLVGRRWSVNIAEIAMGLLTLSAACAIVAVWPMSGDSVQSRCPVLMNSLVVAFAVMTAFWIWVGRVWRQQLNDGVAWTAAGRIALFSDTFALLGCFLGAANAVAMAVWPRMRNVSVADDSLGRMVAGMGGCLFLLMTCLWAARKSGRSSFRILAAIVGLAGVAFIVVRAEPFSSSVHRVTLG